MHVSRTFGRLHLEIDKMGGLQLRSRESAMPLISSHGQQTYVTNVQLWDEDLIPEIGATLIGDTQELWSGVVFSREQIGALFRPFQSDGTTPTKFALRPGGLGRPRTVRVVRLETKDAQNFELTVCNGGEEPQQTLCVIQRHEVVEVALRVADAIWRCVFLHAERDKKKLEKIVS